MMRSTELAWQRRRTVLNHDWLKNRFLTALDAAQNIFSGRIHGEVYLSHLIEDVLLDWASRRGEIEELVASFEMQMSPKVLFETEPLVNAEMDTRRRCGAVIHGLWLGRYPVADWVVSAKRAFANADS